MDGLHKINVGILRGGVSPHHKASLRTGGTILLNLPREKYRAVDMYIDKNGVWHVDGVPVALRNLKSIVDVVWNALHNHEELSGYGNAVQVLEQLGIPYTGSGPEDEKINPHKSEMKKIFRSIGLRTPNDYSITRDRHIPEDNYEDFILNSARDAFQKVNPPWVVKPARGVSADDVRLARNFEELVLALSSVLRNHREVIVEEYIKGREISSGIIENFRGKENYELMPLEIMKKGEVLDREARESGDFRILPAKIANKEEILEAARKIHQLCGLNHYSTCDFMLTPRGLYVIEANSHPVLHEDSYLPQSLEQAGAKMEHFIDHIIEEAIRRKKPRMKLQ
jgi:D-alanine-D-alanine ligase